LIPTERVGAPFPFKIVFGIDVALLPAALAGSAEKTAVVSAITKRIDIGRFFIGNLHDGLMSPV
jgi:hypothetical protein